MPKISELINPPRYTRQNIIHKEEAQEQTVPNHQGLDGPPRRAPAETKGRPLWGLEPLTPRTPEKQSRVQVELNLLRLDSRGIGGDPCPAVQPPCLRLSALAHSPAEPRRLYLLHHKMASLPQCLFERINCVSGSWRNCAAVEIRVLIAYLGPFRKLPLLLLSVEGFKRPHTEA